MCLKSRDHLFLRIAEDDFGFVPVVSRALVQTAKSIFAPDPGDDSVSIGQMKILAISKDEPAGKSIEECKKIEIVVTIESEDDIKVEEKYGRASARQEVMLRITEEAVDYGALLTQEDLSRVLRVSVRTIQRDIKELRKKGFIVQTRGYVKDIGGGTSHKTIIVEQYLKGKEYTQINKEKQHSLQAIKRYIESFSRVVWLRNKYNTSISDIRLITGVSERVIREYLELYERYNTDEYKDRLNEILKDTDLDLKKRGWGK